MKTFMHLFMGSLVAMSAIFAGCQPADTEEDTTVTVEEETPADDTTTEVEVEVEAEGTTDTEDAE